VRHRSATAALTKRQSEAYPADGGDPLRCFTSARNPSINCTAPANGDVFGPPYIMNNVPVVSWATVAATENDPNPTASDAWPTRGIPGALVTTPTGSDGFAPANYMNYTVNNFGGNCSQSHNFSPVGTGIAARPPVRSEHARFAHSAPLLGI